MEKDYSKILVYGNNSKIEKNITYVTRNDFRGPHLNYQDITIPLNLKKQIENSKLDGKPFLELFEYNGVSLWWFFHFGPFFNDHFSGAVYFISKFLEFIKLHSPEKVKILDDFEMLDLIRQICINNNIQLEYSSFHYLKFTIHRKIIQFLHSIVRQYRLKKRIKSRIKTRTKQYHSKFVSIPDINNKILFAIPTSFRRPYYNSSTMTYEKGEYVLQEIIDLLKNKHNLVGMSVEHNNTTVNDQILLERLESGLEWFPQELLLRNYRTTNEHKRFLGKYKKTLSDKKFQQLFTFEGVNMWSQIKPMFEQMLLEIYIPYWINLIDSLSNFLTHQKPKTVFLIAETDAPALALIDACKKNKIKTITIQHGEGFEDCEHNVSNLSSELNPLGCPFPDNMLVFGQFAKDVFVRHGYPEQRFTIVGNPLFFDLTKFESKSHSLYEKFSIDSTKFVILFTTSRYQGYSEKYNYDTLVWDYLLKNFGLNDKFVLILKPHPYESTSRYEKIFLKYNQPRNAKIIDGNILELIQISSLLVSSLSTSIVDAICFKKPVIEMVWEGVQQKQIPFDEFNVTIPTTLEQLSEKIFMILNNFTVSDTVFKNRDVFLHKHYDVPISIEKVEKTLNQLL